MVATIFDYDRYKRLPSFLKVFFSGFYGRIKPRDLIGAYVILEKRIIFASYYFFLSTEFS